MLEIIRQPWSWHVAGTLMGLASALLLIRNKRLEISSSRQIRVSCIPGTNVTFITELLLSFLCCTGRSANKLVSRQEVSQL
jgi:hypothetical protein